MVLFISVSMALSFFVSLFSQNFLALLSLLFPTLCRFRGQIKTFIVFSSFCFGFACYGEPLKIQMQEIYNVLHHLDLVSNDSFFKIFTLFTSGRFAKLSPLILQSFRLQEKHFLLSMKKRNLNRVRFSYLKHVFDYVLKYCE